MCGICGFVGDGSIDDLQRMTEALVHRGPDGCGVCVFEDEGVHLGHRRLSIIDVEGGAQPMATADNRLVVVFNGEIYNHADLRLELRQKGHVFLSDHSDTEVLLHGYRQWGTGLVERLRGMWAFAILDRPRKRIFMSRDRFGKKPLYYSLQNRTFAFASEMSSILRHGNIRANISELGTMKYFAYGYTPAPNTLCERIYKLPAGHNLVLELTSLEFKTEKYWDFSIEPFETIPKNPEMEWGEKIRELLEKAVERRLMSDVPLGIFLSGGIDSSAVSAFAAKIAGRDAVNTFSVGFEENSFDESLYSTKVSKLLGTSHHLEILSAEKAMSLLGPIMERLDDPVGDGSILPTYLLCRATGKKVKVALGGDGADELFAGYDPFRALKLAEIYNDFVPKPVHKGIRMLFSRFPVSHRNMSLDFKIKRTLKGLSYPKPLWNSVWLGPLSPHELTELFDSPVDPEKVYSEAIELWDKCKGGSIVDRTLQFYTKLYLQEDILHKIDRAGMMNSLEVRAPFLDFDLVDFVRRIPGDYKYRDGQTKYILKKALEPVLPAEIIHRSKKGFGAPLGLWYKNESSRTRAFPRLKMFDRRFVEKTVENHLANREDNRGFLFNMHLLGNWMAGFKVECP